LSVSHPLEKHEQPVHTNGSDRQKGHSTKGNGRNEGKLLGVWTKIEALLRYSHQVKDEQGQRNKANTQIGKRQVTKQKLGWRLNGGCLSKGDENSNVCQKCRHGERNVH